MGYRVVLCMQYGSADTARSASSKRVSSSGTWCTFFPSVSGWCFHRKPLAHGHLLCLNTIATPDLSTGLRINFNFEASFFSFNGQYDCSLMDISSRLWLCIGEFWIFWHVFHFENWNTEMWSVIIHTHDSCVLTGNRCVWFIHGHFHCLNTIYTLDMLLVDWNGQHDWV